MLPKCGVVPMKTETFSRDLGCAKPARGPATVTATLPMLAAFRNARLCNFARDVIAISNLLSLELSNRSQPSVYLRPTSARLRLHTSRMRLQYTLVQL